MIPTRHHSRLARCLSSMVVGLACLAAVGAGHAATLYASTTPSGELDTQQVVSINVDAGVGAGLVDFSLEGFRTLDGDNYYVDIFHMSVNGQEVFAGTWNMSVINTALGGTDKIVVNAPGATVIHPDGTQVVGISVPVTFHAGSNVVSFAYNSPVIFEGSARAGFQGAGDEAWALKSVSISGAAPVPEQSSSVLGAAGLLALAGIARRRNAR